MTNNTNRNADDPVVVGAVAKKRTWTTPYVIPPTRAASNTAKTHSALPFDAHISEPVDSVSATPAGS